MMILTIEQVIEGLKLKFTSSNSIPVTRATITKEEWDLIYEYLTEMLSDGED